MPSPTYFKPPDTPLPPPPTTALQPKANAKGGQSLITAPFSEMQELRFLAHLLCAAAVTSSLGTGIPVAFISLAPSSLLREFGFHPQSHKELP